MSGREAEGKHFFVKVATVENEIEAEVIKDALEKEQIPTMIRSFRGTADNGIYALHKGWGNILVPEEFRGKAEEIVSALKLTFNKEPKD